MARLLALITTAPVWAYSKIAGRDAAQHGPVAWLVGVLRWQAQKPGLLASALLVYLLLGAAAPGLKMGSLMAQEVDAGQVITLMDAHATPAAPSTMSAGGDMVSQLKALSAEPNVGLMAALVLAALLMTVVLARARKATKPERGAMDPFERLLQRRMVEKAHEADRALTRSDLLRA